MFNVRLAGGHLYGKQLFTWLSLVVSLMASFCAVIFPTRCIEWDLGLYWASFWGFSYLLFQGRGRLTTCNWMMVGQGPTVLTSVFFLSSIITLFHLPLSRRRPDIDWNTASKGHSTKKLPSIILCIWFPLFYFMLLIYYTAIPLRAFRPSSVNNWKQIVQTSSSIIYPDSFLTVKGKSTV